MGASIWNAPTDNFCAGEFAALGEEWEGAEVIAGDFLQASGHFMCMLQIEGEGMVVISGAIRQGRLNADGSATVCGLGIVVDHFVNEVFFEQPFAVTLRDGPDGFTYYDVVTGPVGDAETVVVGKVKIWGH